MSYADVPAFLKQLREREGMAALALEFAILTAARTSEVIESEWSEFDLDAKVWTVPAERMKAAREHRVPLSGRALEILQGLAANKTGNFVFPADKPGKQLSTMAMAMAMLLRRVNVTGVTVHGFRSSFRHWVGNETQFAREVVEAALAHVIGDKAEQSLSARGRP